MPPPPPPPPPLPQINVEAMEAERAEFFHEDHVRRHDIMNAVQARQFELDAERMRLNRIRAEQNASFGMECGERGAAADRGGGAGRHAQS
jgi:hypothetical protein